MNNDMNKEYDRKDADKDERLFIELDAVRKQVSEALAAIETLVYAAEARIEAYMDRERARDE